MENVYFEYLEKLRESGKTNMFGAVPYLVSEFTLSKAEAKKILFDWFEYKQQGGEENERH